MFITISELKTVCGYKDRRSILKWLHSLGVRSFRVGKNWCVIKTEYETAIIETYEHVQPKKSKKNYEASNPHEQAFLNGLQKFLSHV